LQSEEYRKQGNEFLAAGDVARAEACYRQSVDAAPNSAAAHLALGFVLLQQERLAEADESLERAVSIEPGDADGHYLRGGLARQQGRFDDAIEHFGRALQLNPKLAEAHFNLGAVFRAQGRIDEALQHLSSAIALKQDFREARLVKSLLLLLRGNFAEGLELFESRLGVLGGRQMTEWAALLAAHPDKRRWRGEGLHNSKGLLIWTEEGMGDCIMAMRYLPKLANRGAQRVAVLSDPSLARLVRAVPGVNEVMTEVTQLSPESFEHHCPIMSLPFLFGTRADTIPGAVPYLVVPDEMRERWRRRLSGMKGLKVGLVWSGNQGYASDFRRSLAFSRLAPLLQTSGISFVSLQKGEAAGELKQSGEPVFDPMGECQDFLDTAAVAANLDLVISVDTSVAHLAGALGRPVWLLNRFHSDWRWQLGREDSPWYPTMRIFRQPEPGDWESVLRAAAGALASLAGSRL
jgi:Tetratricopeptide repeat/Glycosyltransferase family 9 (heptosyltransferase)